MLHGLNFIVFVFVYLFILSSLLELSVTVFYCLFTLIKAVFENVFGFVSERWLDGRTVDTLPIYNVVNNIKKRKEGSILRHVPVPVRYKRDRNKSIISCVICLEDLEDGQLCQCLPQCDHIFHEPCVKPWLIMKKNCPICRLPIPV